MVSGNTAIDRLHQSTKTGPSFWSRWRANRSIRPNGIGLFPVENRKNDAQKKQKKKEGPKEVIEGKESFASRRFMHFSKSVIGNINRIERFELSFNGNLCVYFQSGNKEYISRKYVSAVKKRLESGGNHHDI